MRWADNRLLRRMIRDKDHRNLKPHADTGALALRAAQRTEAHHPVHQARRLHRQQRPALRAADPQAQAVQVLLEGHRPLQGRSAPAGCPHPRQPRLRTAQAAEDGPRRLLRAARFPAPRVHRRKPPPSTDSGSGFPIPEHLIRILISGIRNLACIASRAASLLRLFSKRRHKPWQRHTKSP